MEGQGVSSNRGPQCCLVRRLRLTANAPGHGSFDLGISRDLLLAKLLKHRSLNFLAGLCFTVD